jgi:hypothetical protein
MLHRRTEKLSSKIVQNILSFCNDFSDFPLDSITETKIGKRHFKNVNTKHAVAYRIFVSGGSQKGLSVASYPEYSGFDSRHRLALLTAAFSPLFGPLGLRTEIGPLNQLLVIGEYGAWRE